ncbi:putative ribonuclease H-like domain-containing protein [Tanacetum coccineum]
MVPRAVLMKSGQVSLNTARQVNTAHPKITMNSARPMTNLSKTAHSTVKRPIHKNTTFKNSNFNQRVNIVKDKNVNAVRPKAVVNAARPKAVVNAVKGNNVNAVKASACWGNPQIDLQDKGVIDSGCSRHMTGNMSYLTDYEEIDGGYVAFGGNPKGGKITGRVPRKNNMYSVDLKNIVPKGGLTCLFAKATSDESELWHRRLGHINFKTMNKLVKGNLVRGLPLNALKTIKPVLLVKRESNIELLISIDHLGKFDGKANEGFFVGYSIKSKAFRVFNSRTRIVEENLHVQFSDNTPNIAGSTKACDDAGKSRMETVPSKDYILLPLWTADPPFSQSPKSTPDEGSTPSCDDGKKVDEDSRKDREVNVVGGKTSIELPDDPNMSAMEDIICSDDDEDVGAKADMNNLDAFMPVSPILTTRVHKDHPVDQIIEDLNSAPQIRRITKKLEEHGRTQKGNSCIEGSKLDRGYAGRASTIQVTRSLDFGGTDVKSAFIGKIEEEVYDCQPLGFEDPDFPDRVYKVEKALYGLHQAPRAWYETLSTFLLDNGF